jgi:hypothetical protein
VNARIVCSNKAELFKLGKKSGITLRFAYLSQRGYYPEDLYKANQDAFKVVPNFNGNEDEIFFGVFDGHGVDGDSCSYFVRDNIEQELKIQMQKYPNDFEKAYKESFVAVNMKMHEQVGDARVPPAAAHRRRTMRDAARAATHLEEPHPRTLLRMLRVGRGVGRRQRERVAGLVVLGACERAARLPVRVPSALPFFSPASCLSRSRVWCASAGV